MPGSSAEQRWGECSWPQGQQSLRGGQTGNLEEQKEHVTWAEWVREPGAQGEATARCARQIAWFGLGFHTRNEGSNKEFLAGDTVSNQPLGCPWQGQSDWEQGQQTRSYQPNQSTNMFSVALMCWNLCGHCWRKLEDPWPLGKNKVVKETSNTDFAFLVKGLSRDCYKVFIQP